jgi:cytochrome P450
MNLISKLSGWLKATRPSESELLFVFGHPGGQASDAAAELYMSEPAFRESIAQTDLLVKAQGDASVLPFFEKKESAGSGATPFAGLALELALSDLCRSKGLIPAAVLGIGLGEIPALYAAGAISRESAVRWFSAFIGLAQQQGNFVSLFLPGKRISSLPAKLPCEAYPVADLGPQGLVVLCREEDFNALSAYFDENKVIWQQHRREASLPLHTPVLNSQRGPLRAAMEGIVPGPVLCDYYSCTLGGKVPRYALIPHFLPEQLLCAPVYLQETLQEAGVRPWHAVIHCYAGSVVDGAPEAGTFGHLKPVFNLRFVEAGQAGGKWPAVGFQRFLAGRQATAPAAAPEDPLQQFLAHFDIINPPVSNSPQAVSNFLRQYDKVHFLPKSNCWLVLGYELVNQVMQDHETFSNRHYQSIEALLIGADPPESTAMRNMMHPHFTPRAIKEVAEQVDVIVSRQVAQVYRQPRFSLVFDLAAPIAQATMGRFLGMEEAELRALQSTMSRNFYEDNPMDIVKDFFSAYMRAQDSAASGSGMKYFLLNAVRSGDLKLPEAIDFMKAFWIAGNMTTTLHLSNLVHELLIRPGLADRLRQDPSLVSAFIAECLRLNPPAVQLVRICMKDIVLGGKAIPAGSVVIAGTLSANLDPAVFSQADEMLLDRPARRDFSFGSGVHHCLGHHLAKREAQAIVNNILPLLDRLQLDPAAPLQAQYHQMSIYGMAHLSARWV